jgi:hypothetical protein
VTDSDDFYTPMSQIECPLTIDEATEGKIIAVSGASHDLPVRVSLTPTLGRDYRWLGSFISKEQADAAETGLCFGNGKVMFYVMGHYVSESVFRRSIAGMKLVCEDGTASITK